MTTATINAEATTAALSTLDTQERYTTLEANHDPTTIPTFSGDDETSRVSAIRSWLDDRVNAGVTDDYWNDYLAIDCETDVPVRRNGVEIVPTPEDSTSSRVSYLCVNLTDTLDAGSIDTPVPNGDSAQALWNFLCVVAESTGASIVTEFSGGKSRNLLAYLVYDTSE